MAEARASQAWNHTTAAVLALLVNVNHDPRRGRPATPADFHPLPARKRTPEPPPLEAEITVLETVFVGGR